MIHPDLVSKTLQSIKPPPANKGPANLKPFGLSTKARHDKNAARDQQKLEELKQRELNYCTFKPVTNESKNKDILLMMMESQQQAAAN